jgi:alpha-ribazole phosphatase/probable phosphoglycerate mutase
MIEIVFETHSWSEANERGLAGGWHPGRLSTRGRELAQELGARRRADNLSAVFTSDLWRAVETAQIALDDALPVFADWRLRGCDYGELTGTPIHDLRATRERYLATPYPGGESWRSAVERVGSFFGDLKTRWSGLRVLIVGHVATRWALDHLIDGVPLEELVAADFGWREGWEYRLP